MPEQENHREQSLEARLEQRLKENASYIAKHSELSTEIKKAAEQVLSGIEDLKAFANWVILFDILNGSEKIKSSTFMIKPELNNIMSKLEVLFMADTKNFNKLREMYPIEEYQTAWDKFYQFLNRRQGSFMISIARNGRFFDGLNLEKMQIVNIPEFTTCQDTNFQEAIFSGGLTNIDWSGANLKNADFSQALLTGFHTFTKTNLAGTTFKGADTLLLKSKDLPEWALQELGEK